MKTIAFRTAVDVDDAAPRVADHLRAGGLIAYPTETVYGLGSALLPGAITRLAELKGREEGKPFLVLTDRPEALRAITWTPLAEALARAFWPGPLTIAVPANLTQFPAGIVGPGGTLAIRSSPHPGVRALVRALGGAVTSTSANLPGQPPAMSAEDAALVIEALGDPDDLWLLDGGTLAPSAPSTVVDASGTMPRVLRVGAVSEEEIRRVAGEFDGR